MGMKILIIIYVSKLRHVQLPEGMTSPWSKSKVDRMLESIFSPRGPSMHGINYLRILCMLVVLITIFKTRVENCLVRVVTLTMVLATSSAAI